VSTFFSDHLFKATTVGFPNIFSSQVQNVLTEALDIILEQAFS